MLDILNKVNKPYFFGHFTLVFLLTIVMSCQKIPEQVENSLKLAKNNRKELEKVIEHYQSPKDSLKLRAAFFLIRNMTNKYSVQGEQLKRYDQIFPLIKRAEKDQPFVRGINMGNRYPKADSLWKSLSNSHGYLSLSNLTVVPDLHVITSDYLIENIEYAFRAWGLPWCKHLNFEEFCEYILPYRFKDETLTPWRPLIFERYASLIDTLKHLNDPVLVCNSINKDLMSWWRYSHTFNQYPVAMTAENLMTGKMGTCSHQAGLGIFVMRALGVPVVHETIPHYGNRSLGHDFNGVLGKDGLFLDFEGGMSQTGNVVNTRISWNFLIPKIHRRTFSIVDKSLAVIKSEGEQIPPYFTNPCLIDVTAQYLPTTDIKVELTKQIPDNSYHAYLCTFDNKDWKVISWAKIKQGEATFVDMGKGFVYMPMFYSEHRLIPASLPIIVRKEGDITPIAPTETKQSLVLKRKYTAKEGFKALMINGKFQASKYPDFRDAITLHNIKDSLDLTYQNSTFDSPENFRYVRYLFPQDKSKNIAEMSFYSDTGLKLTGNIISSTNIAENVTLDLAFDDDVLSFFYEDKSEEFTWLGLDFGADKTVSELSFCPRTDKNNVWKGLNYELFYWDAAWKSLGVQKATSDSLVYDSPVSNALFLLRCLDEGKEERIFTYENGKQVWW